MFSVRRRCSIKARTNEITVAYMRILVYAVNGSFSPDADPRQPHHPD